MDTRTKLAKLRELMRQHSLDYYFVPGSDAHQNEYVPKCWQRRTFISGFTGSAGDVLIGLDKAYLWTDGRYLLQAQKELDLTLFEILSYQQGKKPAFEAWVEQHGKEKNLGLDPATISATLGQKLEKKLHALKGKLKLTPNLVDAINPDLPPLPCEPVEVYPVQYAGMSAGKKLGTIRKDMSARGVQALIIAKLDDLAWVLNIRGREMAFSPLVIAYTVVMHDTTHLFVDAKKMTPAVNTYFADNHIKTHDYEDFFQFLETLNGKVWLDPEESNYLTLLHLKQADVYFESLPTILIKALKNPAEQAGAIEAHLRDAVAMIEFLYWLEDNWQAAKLTEISAADKLHEFRAKDPDFRDETFTTISGFGANGAIIHYHPSEKTDTPLSSQALYLLDSGGQYLQGTTDITRTLHLGKPTPEEKHHYTLVLKGHLALARARFAKGTCGEHLDILARQFLYQEGYNYAHGTGHGVGAYLCGHEGPQRISCAQTMVPLQAGMIVSNEPGLYLPERYGIRIENLCLIVKADESEFGEFFGFKDLTLVPYCRRLIHLPDLTNQEIAQINAYHQEIREKVLPRLSKAAQAWLLEETAPL